MNLAPYTELTPGHRPQLRLREALAQFEAAQEGHDVVFLAANLTKRFGYGGPLAVGSVNLTLRKGEITGVVGVNGSGKSTLLRMVAGVLEPTSGTRAYPALGCKPHDWVTIRRSIAFVEQRPKRWPGTVEAALSHHAAFFGNRGAEGRELVEFYLHRLDLDRHRHKKWSQLSGGYRMRVELAKAMLSKPRLLVLDEPLAPLDIPAQMQFLEDLDDFAKDPMAPMPVLLSSQHIYEVESVAMRMIVLSDGKPAYAGLTAEVGKARKANYFEITCDLDARSLGRALEGCDLQRVTDLGARSFFVVTDRTTDARQITGALMKANAKVRHFRDASESTRRFFDL